MMDRQVVADGSPAASDTSRKRPAPSPDPASQQRRTRGTYTSVACDGCKKRKLKCIPLEDRTSCERCHDKGLSCQYTQAHDLSQTSKSKSESRQCHAVRTEIAQLRHEFAGLSEYVRTLGTHMGFTNSHPLSPEVSDKPAPKQPQFVGPMRPAYGFILGQDSLNNMGIPAVEHTLSSRSDSPMPEAAPGLDRKDLEFWRRCTVAEITKILLVVQEEVEEIYPFLVTDDLIAQTPELLDIIQKEESGSQVPFSRSPEKRDKFDSRDVDFLKLAVSLGLNLEAKVRTELSDATIKSIEMSATRLTGPEADFKHVQFLLLLSMYHFHTDGELLAWRTIGVAARAAIEMGLNRKSTVDEKFPDKPTRQLAVRAYWCVFLLDRRFAFGTGLSWALPEDDMDPDMPRPGIDHPYLNCMVSYVMMCHAIWKAIPPFRPPSTPLAKDVVERLDRNTLSWMETIPPDLKLRHPRSRPPPQPSADHRLRAMLYLRGNHTRILTYRHCLFSAAKISEELMSANLVVDIAKDSIEVLVHLNATTDIYSRQQSTYNFFLVGALSAIFLAVCHAPKIFRESCKRSFHDAVELIRGFSANSSASKRLWRSIRDLLPRLRGLDPQAAPELANPHHPHHANYQPSQQQGLSIATDRRRMSDRHPGSVNPNEPPAWSVKSEYTPSLVDETPTESMGAPSSAAANVPYNEAGFDMSVPDFMQMGDNLMDLFDIFGQMDQRPAGAGAGMDPKAPNAGEYTGPDQFAMGDWDSNGVMMFPGFV